MIAEPGRYFAEACATYACYINGWRGRAVEGGQQAYDYYITDGLYGSMNWWVRVVVELGGGGGGGRGGVTAGMLAGSELEQRTRRCRGGMGWC